MPYGELIFDEGDVLLFQSTLAKHSRRVLFTSQNLITALHIILDLFFALLYSNFALSVREQNVCDVPKYLSTSTGKEHVALGRA